MPQENGKLDSCRGFGDRVLRPRLSRILRFEYLEASRSAGTFLNEESYEWHIDETVTDESDQALILAARRWRKKLNSVPPNCKGNSKLCSNLVATPPLMCDSRCIFRVVGPP